MDTGFTKEQSLEVILMNIKPYDKTIRDLLGSKRQFYIPRFQREYSWEKKNYQEFFDDMMNSLQISNGKISASQYFLGTMLFIGNFAEGTDQVIQVVDGQQRLTTITILFSALSDRFRAINEPTLSQQIFAYIMTTDDNGSEVRILKSKTSYPFFAYYIQDKDKEIEPEAITDEEVCIKEAYEYFSGHLKKDKLKATLKRKHGSEVVDALPEVEILKALRDQVLNSTFVSISTTDRDQANVIFEILNAKGKRLAYVDLIKNKIFEVLKKEEPADFAEETWRQIQETLNSGKENVGMATFYYHYWISKYKKSYSNRLYDDFKKEITPKTEERYTDFLKDVLKNACTYMQIVNPKREDYQNRKEYFWLVQSLKCLNDYLNVVQVRVALLALIDVKERGIIDHAMLKRAVCYMENFHFAYNAILSNRANRTEKIYSSFAIELRKCTDKASAKVVINSKLIRPLDALFPTFEEFYKKFINLSYSKSNVSLNTKTRYAINKLNCLFSGKEIFEDDGSIEHLICEVEGEFALNIGNLILFEKGLNEEAGQNSYENKMPLYQRSQYKWVKDFIAGHATWTAEKISSRAIDLAKAYYEKIFGRGLPDEISDLN